jgi:Carbohydrate-binding family 9
VRFDGKDDAIVATLTQRDDPLWTEDVFEVFLTPHDPPSVYYELEINPLGALFDARVESPDLERATMRADPSWNLRGLSGRSQVRPGRWSATLSIPMEPLLDGRPPATVWRANFFRVDRGDGGRRDEFSAWSPTGKNPADFHVPARFGILDLPAGS